MVKNCFFFCHLILYHYLITLEYYECSLYVVKISITAQPPTASFVCSINMNYHFKYFVLGSRCPAVSAKRHKAFLNLAYLHFSLASLFLYS